MRALVTGGGGFLGTRIVEMLRDRGDQVVVLGRGRYAHHEQLGIQCLQADVRDARAVREACRGIDVVFHVAALPKLWGRRRDFWDINVRGTQNVVDVCRDQGVRRLVHTSTPSVVFGADDLCGVDESQPYPKRYLALYPETKAAAERLVLEANGATLATIALRPHLIFGPGDPHLIPRVIARARQGRLVQVGDGRNLVDVTYIDNAAEAHLRAADAISPGASCAGRAYFISQGEPVALWPWLNGLLAAVSSPQVTRAISFRSAYRLGAAIELIYRLGGISREPRMTRFLATQLAMSHYFNIAAARRDLGYEPRVSTEAAVERLLSWLRGPSHPFSGSSPGPA